MREIRLSKGKVALVDDDDYEKLAQWNWTAEEDAGTWYAIRCQRGPQKNYVVKQKRLYMHREILGLKTGDPLVDHKNHDGLDNQRQNLRLANKSINAQNRRTGTGTSLYLGVSWRKRSRRWVAQMGNGVTTKNLGEFVSEIDAAKAYDTAVRLRYGPEGRTNFPTCPASE